MNTSREFPGPLLSRAAAAVSIAASLSILGGCAGSASPRSASAEPAASVRTADRALAKAEQAVQRAPQDAAARAALAQAYLAAGRFQSAATTFDDAMSLGDNSARTALGLALAQIGLGRQREAVALLDDWRAEIPASDLGLALALAGEPARGVAILSDAARSGESTPKLRQNLAYAYALSGRWTEARVMAAQDLPAAELDRRMAIWALSALPDRTQERVAGLIGAPLRSDPGQPAALALRSDPVGEQLAAQSARPLPAAPAPVAATALAQAGDELPATPATAESVAVTQNLAAQTDQPVAEPAGKALPRPSVASAFARLTPKPARPARPALMAAAAVSAVRGTHLVQLGAFSSKQGARRAWGIFVQRTPHLASFRMTITQANVRGKQLWRVAAAGLNGSGAASGLCSQVKSGGGACFAYATPLRPTAVPVLPGRDLSGPQRARR
ncbi:tetratricopeptide repeat protein [Novosphingobium flavum]|uniref:tetratricopeptide repeat protein n=1 Tax=Novosphingobium aerophilum TaxID=2839843 RepID=UPI00163B4E44|nr:tetratricopeptide repeat protein [Novosphingobium aerophilum]MBC2663196.1 tetratricopeptide repeat protein [Novosphingobium aerophilum]